MILKRIFYTIMVFVFGEITSVDVQWPRVKIFYGGGEYYANNCYSRIEARKRLINALVKGSTGRILY